MLKKYSAAIGILALVVLSGVSFFFDMPVLFLSSLIEGNRVGGAAIFVSIMCITTVVAPLTSLPLVPIISPVFGPLVTALLSIVGWTLGAVIAFLIARHAGRPLLARFVSLEAMDRYEHYIPHEARFLTIVALRMVIPVDVLSYALGVLSSVSLFEYTLATGIGIAWFAFAFSYLGNAAFENNVVLFVVLGVASLIVFGLSFLYVVQQMRKKK